MAKDMATTSPKPRPVPVVLPSGELVYVLKVATPKPGDGTVVCPKNGDWVEVPDEAHFPSEKR
jgi:hypothetical protein